MPNNKLDKPSSNDFFKSIREAVPGVEEQKDFWYGVAGALGARAIAKNVRKK
jgi:hypothetical protein